MLPVLDALVPALGCVNCKRVIPQTSIRGARTDKAAVNRALRAARRSRMNQERE